VWVPSFVYRDWLKTRVILAMVANIQIQIMVLKMKALCPSKVVLFASISLQLYYNILDSTRHRCNESKNVWHHKRLTNISLTHSDFAVRCIVQQQWDPMVPIMRQCYHYTRSLAHIIPSSTVDFALAVIVFGTPGKWASLSTAVTILLLVPAFGCMPLKRCEVVCSTIAAYLY
jgi:hypothetical protein